MKIARGRSKCVWLQLSEMIRLPDFLEHWGLITTIKTYFPHIDAPAFLNDQNVAQTRHIFQNSYSQTAFIKTSCCYKFHLRTQEALNTSQNQIQVGKNKTKQNIGLWLLIKWTIMTLKSFKQNTNFWQKIHSCLKVTMVIKVIGLPYLLGFFQKRHDLFYFILFITELSLQM